ncbi:MAG: ABC transporter ATP-binding protein [Nitrospirota bacterium]|nr:ABC transporter ATP-binding protein [Nitrospirota bacterium]
MSNVIRFDKVSRWFETASVRFDALKNIDLQIEEGNHVAVVGKSGSGKSTLLNMLTGIDHPNTGTVRINSTDVHALNESSLASWRGKNIGIVFQFFQLIPTLTIEENILMAMDFVDVIPARARIARARALLAQVGIAQHADKLPSELSGGEQQRAAIARALANDPPIVVADEPTGNLDSKTTEIILKLFQDLVRAGKTVIVVTHDSVSQAAYDRIITLRDGAIVDDMSLNRGQCHEHET